MRFFGALAFVAVVASVALGNGAPPPAPKGKKSVHVANELLLGKDVSGYVFVERWGTAFKEPQTTFKKVEPNDKKPVQVASSHYLWYATLYAIPEASAKEFKNDKELFEALAVEKVKGVHMTGLAGDEHVDEKVKGNEVTWTYTITSIDKKDGIKVEVKGEGYEKPTEKKDEKKPLALAEPGYLVGGFAAAVSITLGGLWLVRRNASKMKA